MGPVRSRVRGLSICDRPPPAPYKQSCEPSCGPAGGTSELARSGRDGTLWSVDAFDDLTTHGFVRVGVAIPEVRIADPAYNAEATVALLKDAAAKGVALCAFPELGLTAYTCDDLFHQRTLLDAARTALEKVRRATTDMATAAIVGLPLVVDGMLANVAAVVHGGHVRGLVPKTYLPNYREFYELRQFTPGDTFGAQAVTVGGGETIESVPFGSKLLFATPHFTFHVEICEDVWATIPPSSFGALAGATVLVNLSASNALVGKHEYRRSLGASQSARCLAAYVYSAAGTGESTTDLAWDGHGMVHENGSLLAETKRYARESQLIIADVDIDRLQSERMRQNSYGMGVARHRDELSGFRTIPVPVQPSPRKLERAYAPFPFVPTDPSTRADRCREVLDIQVHGLAQRLKAMGSDKAVIGISGGLDSTLALLVCARAMDVLGHARTGILAFTMPGFATSARTLDQARRLMAAVGSTASEIDIRPSCRQMLADIGHPFARGEEVYDITFENVQAGERTSHLFRIANLHNAPVVGTSDLSEIALGWCTYGVGDHMAHYHVNASVPKTLVQHLIRFAAETGEVGSDASAALLDVLATEISPELVPASATQPGQASEAVVGPYELQDFHMYAVVRSGFTPRKVAYLAERAWGEKYSRAERKHWLGVFLRRFFETSQFKRSAMPNAPKIGSGGSLSPRGDWRAPSDSSWAAWEADWKTIPD